MTFHVSVSGASEAEKGAVIELAEQYCESNGIDPVMLHRDIVKGIEGADDAWCKIELAAGVVFKNRHVYPSDFRLEWNDWGNTLAALKISAI